MVVLTVLYTVFFAAQLFSVNLDAPGKNYTFFIYGGAYQHQKRVSPAKITQQEGIKSGVHTSLRINKRFHPVGNDFDIPACTLHISPSYPVPDQPLFGGQLFNLDNSPDTCGLRGPPAAIANYLFV